MRALLSMVVIVVVLSGCDFGVRTCKPESVETDCGAGNSCSNGFCVAGDGGGTTGGGGGSTTGGGGGLTGGGGGSTGGGTGGGGGADYCDAGLSCPGWQRCTPSATGGSCTTVVARISWLFPDAGFRTQDQTVQGTFQAVGAPGGTAVPLTRVAGASSSTTLVTGGPQFFSMLMLAEGANEFIAGWPDGGPVDRLTVVRDTTGPELTLDPLPQPDAGYITAQGVDLRIPGGAAYRKDDVLTVRVRTNDTDVNPGAVQVRVAFGGNTPVVETTSSQCTGAGLCREFQVDLSKVPMAAFRGQFTLTASAVDTLGNPGMVSTQPFDVTRFNWAREIVSGAQLRSTPAIGTGGRLFVPVGTGSTSVVAVQPDGTQAWAYTSGGPVVGPIAVGRTNGSSEWVVFQQATTGMVGSIGFSGGGGTTCSTGFTATPSEGGLALVGEGTNEVGGVALQPGEVGLRATWDLPNASDCRNTLDAGLSRIQAPGNLVANSTSVYFVDSAGNLKQLDYVLGSRSISQTPLAVGVGGVGIVNGLAMLSGTRVAGGGPGIGRLFAIDLPSGLNAWTSPTVLNAPTSGPAIGAGGTLFAQVRDGNKSALIRVQGASGVVDARTALEAPAITSSFSGNGVGTPALGADGRVYSVDENGRLFVISQAFSTDAGVEWASTLPVTYGNAVEASPTIDCNRRNSSSQTGVLYIATTSGWLVSYLVDAKGLDTTAIWPKYGRDARNTGNSAGPAIACP